MYIGFVRVVKDNEPPASISFEYGKGQTWARGKLTDLSDKQTIQTMWPFSLQAGIYSWAII